MTEKEILKRIKELLEVFHLSTNAFSQQIGLPQNSVNNYMKEKRGISIGFISSILNTYPNISADFILSDSEYRLYLIKLLSSQQRTLLSIQF